MDQSVTPSGEPERWLPVPGWEGEYEVSDLGRVRRVLRWPVRSMQRGRRATTIRKQFFNNGYLTVGLSRDNKVRTFRVHTLVAAAFLGPRPEGMEVCHGPSGKTDNRAANLSYGTRKQNQGPDKRRDGTITQGIRNAAAKLDDDSVREMRARWAAGETRQSLAREFGVTDRTVGHVVSRFTWRHVALACRVLAGTVNDGAPACAVRHLKATAAEVAAAAEVRSVCPPRDPAPRRQPPRSASPPGQATAQPGSRTRSAAPQRPVPDSREHARAGNGRMRA